MTKVDLDFETWAERVMDILADKGVGIWEREWLRDAYDDGRDLFDVVDEIVEGS